MAKKPAAAPAATAINTINRKRRNSFMRKCITKNAKRIFKNSGHEVFKILARIHA